MPRGTHLIFASPKKGGPKKGDPGICVPLRGMPSLWTIEAVVVKTRPAASNIDPKNPAPLVPHSA